MFSATLTELLLNVNNMWELKFIYLHPIVELEDECILLFDTDLQAWNFYERLNKSNNVLAVYRPRKLN